MPETFTVFVFPEFEVLVPLGEVCQYQIFPTGGVVADKVTLPQNGELLVGFVGDAGKDDTLSVEETQLVLHIPLK